MVGCCVGGDEHLVAVKCGGIDGLFKELPVFQENLVPL